MATKKKKNAIKKKKAPMKPRPAVRNHPLKEERVDVERIALIIATPENNTRVKAAKAAGVVDRTLRRWLRENPVILTRALELTREASAGTMITGYRRLDGIIAKGNPKNCIAAMKLLAQLRGELILPIGNAENKPFRVETNDPRIAGLTDAALAALVAAGVGRGKGSGGPASGGGT